MALNLNKSNNEENSLPSDAKKKGINISKSDDQSHSKPNLSKEQTSNPSGKKGINLSKSQDSSKLGLNLSKNDEVSSNSNISNETKKTETKKKKSPILILVTLAVLILGGIFWFINNTNKKQAETVLKTEVPVTLPAEADAADGQSAEITNTITENNLQSGEASSTPTETAESLSVSANSKNINSNGIESPAANQLSTTSEASTMMTSGSIEEKARQVISGAYGNGLDRKSALGDEYSVIQAKVNEIYQNNPQ
jgi:hypothetical protein